jgi:TonB-dependent receptor
MNSEAHTAWVKDRARLLLTAGTAALALAATPAAAQSTQEGTSENQVIVTGRAAQQSADQEKHDATIVAEVISAERLAAVPVNSVVDGLKRLPGISVVTSYGNAEPRYITVRGLDSAYNVYTLNGVRLPTAEDSRAVALDLFAPDAVSSVRIIKTVTPDLDGDALGATVDIRTASPFDHPTGWRMASARIGYDESTQKAPVDLSAGFSAFLDHDKRLGLLVTGFYSHRQTIAARNTNPDQANSWQRPAGASDTQVVDPRTLTLVSHGLDQFTNNVTKFGGDGMLEFRPDDANRFYLRASYERWKNPQRHDYLNVLDRFDDNGAINGFRTLIGAEIKEEDNRLGSIGLGGSNHFGALTASYDLAYSYGRTRTPQQYYMEFNSDSSTDPTFNTPINFQASNPRYPKWVLSDAQARAMYNVANLGLSDAELYNRRATDNQLFGRFDLAWEPAEPGLLRSAKAGFRVRRASRRYNQHQIADILNGDQYAFQNVKLGTPLSTLPTLLGGTIDSYQDGQYSGNTRFGTILNMDQALRLLESAPQVTDADYPWNLNKRYGTETSYSGYGMAVVGSAELNTTVGARFERTEIYNEYLTTISNPDGSVTRVYGGPNGTSRASYNNFLPSIHVNWRPTAAIVARGAVWTSFARPNFLDISGASTIDRSAGVITISQGNPNLHPAKAINVDANVDYATRTTLLSLGGFFKSIDGFMYGRAQSMTTTRGQTVIVQPVNGNTATVWGIEFGGRQTLIGGLSFTGNVTWQHSEADPGGTGRVPGKVWLPNAPRWIYNMGLSYEQGRWSGDLNFNYQGKRLAVLRPSGLDEWNQPIRALDLALRYRPTDAITVTLAGKNLTGAQSYWGTHSDQQIATVAYQTAPRTYYLSVTFHQ